MASLPGILPDGALKTFDTPKPCDALGCAASSGDLEVLQAADKEALSRPDDTGNTPLIWAADAGQATAVSILIDANADVNVKGFLGNTALARAARGGHIDCVVGLLACPNIDPNTHNDKLQYPLHFAAFKRHPDVVQAMLGSGKCDPMVRDRKGRTPAEDTNDTSIQNMILEAQSARRAGA
mmetsp:Transcript_14267/g.39375  ORF Transcript_14267/g.39375 Transcript_14267/m.39375 type:complete len:181 (+) Transcript_14267:107-649(+)|eukprot:CAMPEP_0117495000 /NCGR_PEP_ID=MMETSP0784-20121206/19907_1 /TAXON_ID=39447 /ORGANISM="" /LENGTH=180 /DNA_ID=CAMNT_0005289909 /DNA_START=97 /DNA_END=639 /DNA_ORIENTATION=+